MSGIYALGRVCNVIAVADNVHVPLKAGSGVMTQKALEQQCHLAAQRMNMLYGFNSPEFFDRALFENFIDLLRERSVLKAGEGGNLEFDEVLVRVAADAQLVLSEQIL